MMQMAGQDGMDGGYGNPDEMDQGRYGMAANPIRQSHSAITGRVERIPNSGWDRPREQEHDPGGGKGVSLQRSLFRG